MKLLSEFESPPTSNLAAKVYLTEDNNYFVGFYRDAALVGSQSLSNKTLQYAEDAAENFVMGYGQFDF